MKRLNDLLSGKEDIKVASIDTPLITSNGRNALIYDNTHNLLSIGELGIGVTSIYGGENVTLSTEEYGDVFLSDEGFVINASVGVQINNGLSINSGGLKPASYTTALRPSPVGEGAIIYDSTLKKCILWNGTAWVNLDGTALA